MYKRIGDVGGYGYGNTGGLLNWIGTNYMFVSFVTPTEEDGLVLEIKGKPEVWIGDVDSFISFQEFDSEDWEEVASWNETYENGLLWAFARLGGFDKDDPRDIPRWAIEMISNDPELLWRELVDDLIPILGRLPVELEQAVRVWLNNRRREQEKASGQAYLWPDIRQGG